MLLVIKLLVLVELASGIKVIATDKKQRLPPKNGYVEILNSSLSDYETFSLCGRFLTYQFTSHPDTQTFQILLSMGQYYLGMVPFIHISRTLTPPLPFYNYIGLQLSNKSVIISHFPDVI